MSRSKAKIWAYICLAAAFHAVIIYYFYFRQLISEILEGRAPDFYEKLIGIIYPRFIEERARFDFEFIDALVWQIFMRLAVVFFIAFLALWLYAKNRKARSFISVYWNATTTRANLYGLSIVFYPFVAIVALTYLLPDLLGFIDDLAFYKPITFYKWFDIPYPTATAIKVYIFTFLGLLVGICTRYKVVFSTLAALLFVYLAGFLFCFEKVNHGHALISYIMLLMPFFFYAAKHEKDGLIPAWPLKLIQLIVASAYFLASMEKVMYSKFDFIDPDSFRILLQYHNIPAGMALSEIPLLLYVLPPLIMAIQLCFPLILVYPKYKWLFVGSVLLFHIGVAVFLGLIGFIYLWGISYIFYLDLERVWWKLTGKKSASRELTPF